MAHRQRKYLLERVHPHRRSHSFGTGMWYFWLDRSFYGPFPFEIYTYRPALCDENTQTQVAANQPSSTVARSKRKAVADVALDSSLEILTLDWETDSAINVRNALGARQSINMLVACDCIYNDFLVKPFVQMCLDICALRPPAPSQTPTVVLIAQQLRSDEVFLEWLRAMTNGFYVWRIPDECLSKELQSGSGYALHLALKK
jgi:hypothetical protein